MNEIEKAIKEAGIAHDRRVHGRRKEDIMHCEEKVIELVSLINKFRQWDMLDSTSDGIFWKNEIDLVLSKILGYRSNVSDCHSPSL